MGGDQNKLGLVEVAIKTNNLTVVIKDTNNGRISINGSNIETADYKLMEV